MRPVEDPTAQFAELVQGPEAAVPLGHAALLIAAHAHPNLDVERRLADLDALALGCPVPSFEGWRRHLYIEQGFRGNVDDYHDPENSFLDSVLRRRVGLPITLSVLGLEVGRRLGLRLAGVGMPGHFLLQDLDSVPPRWVDPFARGRVLDRAECEERFRVVNGRDTAFHERYLQPVGARSVLGRMLTNLKAIYIKRGDLAALEWVFALRLAIPGTPALERRDLARVRSSVGQFLRAAQELEDLAATLTDKAPALIAEADALRARLN